MIFEMRIYDIAPTGMPDYLALYREQGVDLQRKYLGEMVGFFQTEVGPLNQAISIWRYETFEDRMARRSALAADPAWQSYVAAVRKYFVQQKSRLLTGTDFSPLR